MGNGLRFANSHTRCWFCTTAGSATSTAILDPLTFLMFYEGYGFFAEDVNLIHTHIEDFGRADFRTITATAALFRVDGDVPIA